IEIDLNPWPAHTGTASIDLSTDREMVLKQTVELIPGKQYKLSFQLRKNPCGNGKFFFKVTPAGVPNHKTLYMEMTGTNTWEKVEQNFMAESDFGVLSFGSLSGSSCGPVIDSVELVPSASPLVVSGTNMIENPSFEYNPGCGGNSWCMVDDDQVPAWKATGGRIELDKTVWPAYNGDTSIDLSTDRETILYQPLALVPGRRYRLNFALRKNECGNGKFFFKIAPQHEAVTKDSNEIFPYGRYTGTGQWRKVGQTFTVSHPNVNVMFGSDSGSSCGPVIDAVEVIAV
ncbi:MAG: hypothetical protein SGCHY_005553, partial [Lobulomycetales sp.]